MIPGGPFVVKIEYVLLLLVIIDELSKKNWYQHLNKPNESFSCPVLTLSIMLKVVVSDFITIFFSLACNNFLFR